MGPSAAQLSLHRHTAFGLTIESCLPLPELLPAAEGASADVEIHYDDVPAELPGTLARGVRYQSAPGALRLQVDGVAKYLVRSGRSIAIARDLAADDDDVRLFLLGSAFGALLHQRDDLVLHGSAIAVGELSVGFLGVSGSGKSTLAAAFRKRGYPVLTDDLCVVRPASDGRMMVYPGFPQTKLWLDSLEQLDVLAEDLRRIRNKIEKRAVPLGRDFATVPSAAKKLYLLRPSNKDELKLTAVQGPEKFAVIKNYTYRFGFLAGIDDKTGHFQQALRLAQQVPLAIVSRPREPFRLKELADMLEADFRA